MEGKTGVLLAAALFLVLFVFGVSGAAAFDEETFYFINRDLKNDFLDAVMPPLTHTGRGEFQGVIAALLYLQGERETAEKLICSLLRTGLIVCTMKRVFRHPRPLRKYESVEVLGDYVLRGEESFPSGHTASSFAVAEVLSSSYPEYSRYFFLHACLVGFSRVYMGVHHPRDVLVGALVGYIIGRDTVKKYREGGLRLFGSGDSLGIGMGASF